MLPSLNSAMNIQFALAQIRQQIVALYSAADTQAPEATPDLHNVLDCIDDALKQVAKYANHEHAEWLKAEYERQQRGFT